MNEFSTVVTKLLKRELFITLAEGFHHDHKDKKKNCRNAGQVEQHVTELHIYLCGVWAKDLLVTCLLFTRKKKMCHKCVGP